jgi:homoserine O-acetyltransferase/O-succinyltransferase
MDYLRSALNPHRTHFHTFDEPLPLDCGRSLAPYSQAYQTWGKLNADRSNAILIFHALSGDAHVSGRHEDGRTGWWDLMVGPGAAFDTDRYFIICANVLGGCKGTAGPSSPNPETNRPYGSAFPLVTLEDMVRAQGALLDRLDLDRLHAVAGASMGGMLALAFARLFPARAERIIVIASATSNHPQAIAWNDIGRRAIMNDPHWLGGDYYDSPAGPPKRGLAVARMIGHVTYISEGAMDRKFGRALQSGEKKSYSFGIDYSVESYLAYQGQSFHERFDANSYLHITRAIDYFDFAGPAGGNLTAAFAQTRARFRFFSYDADWLYAPARSEAMTQAARAAGREAEHHLIHAPLGHDAFLVQKEPQTELIRSFLQ